MISRRPAERGIEHVTTVEIHGEGPLAVEVLRLARSAGLEVVAVPAGRSPVATSQSDVVLELGSHDAERKREVLLELSERTSVDVPIATFTPSISVHEVGRGAFAPERIVGLSMLKSPLPAAVVEVGGHRGTAAWALDRVCELWRQLGRTPVRGPDSPGMIGQRLMFAQVNDAARFVRSTGLAPDVVDTAMRLGTAVPRGPFELARVVGPELCVQVLQALHQRSGDPRFRPVPGLAELASSAGQGVAAASAHKPMSPSSERAMDDGPRTATIGVVGTGVIGSGVVAATAGAGYDVVGVGRSPESAARGASAVDRLLARAQESNAPLGSIRWSTRLRDLRGCDLVIEAVVEDRMVKEAVLRVLGRSVSPDGVLATTTSSLSVEMLGQASGRPRSFVGLHFFNPVTAMPLVELIPTGVAEDEAVGLAVRFAESLGKQVIVAPDTPGFIVNRLLFPMINDAFALVEDGSASPQMVDAVIEGSFGHPMGPFALADLVGLDVTERIVESLARADSLLPAPRRLLGDLVRAGVLGRKSGRGLLDERREKS